MPKPPFPPPHGGGPRKKMKISEITDIIYLTGNDIEFYKTEGELLGAKIKDYDGRVNLYRIFPITYENQYISVRNADLSEIGIIKDLAELSESQRELANEELSRRYFTPKITKVIDAKQEFGNFFWHVETTSGERKFSMRDLANNIIRTKDRGIILVDMDGSRYALENPQKDAGKAMKFLDIWL